MDVHWLGLIQAKADGVVWIRIPPTLKMKALSSFETSVNTHVPYQMSVTLEGTAVQTSSLPEFLFLEGGELRNCVAARVLAVRGRSVKLAVQRRWRGV